MENDEGPFPCYPKDKIDSFLPPMEKFVILQYCTLALFIEVEDHVGPG